jgi:hypothetical protein
MHAQTCFNITIQNEKFVLEAGLVAGVSKGAEFTIYANSDRSFENPLGILIVDKLGPFSANLNLPPGAPYFTLGQPSIALQTKIGQRKDLQLYVPSNDDFGAGYDALSKLLEWNCLESINFVDNPEDADFELAMKNQHIIFLYRDKRITQYGLTQLYANVISTPEELAPVLKSAAYFYWKLNRTNNNPEINNSVQVELHRLLPPKIQTLKDISESLVPIGPNLYKDGIMNVVADTNLNIPYGFKLTNNTPHDLYPYLFYFDLSDLSVVSYYETPSTAKRYTLDVPLPKNGGVLTIGYGTGGAPAQTFYLRTGQNLDIGFLKIFLCTEPVDLSTIAQSSPFEKTRSPGQLTKIKEKASGWGTMLIPILQRLSDPASFQQTQQTQQILHAQEDNAQRQKIDILYEKASEVDLLDDHMMGLSKRDCEVNPLKEHIVASSSEVDQPRNHVVILKEKPYSSQEAQKHMENLLATKPHGLETVQQQRSHDSEILLETIEGWFWSLFPQLKGRVLQAKKLLMP